MAFTTVPALLVFCLAAAACGRPPDAAPAGEPQDDRSGPATDAVAAARIQECAGVTVEREPRTSLMSQRRASRCRPARLSLIENTERLVGLE